MAQTSAGGLSGGYVQRQSMPQAASGFVTSLRQTAAWSALAGLWAMFSTSRLAAAASGDGAAERLQRHERDGVACLGLGLGSGLVPGLRSGLGSWLGLGLGLG